MDERPASVPGEGALQETLFLVQAAQAGDQAALDRLFAHYMPWVRRTVALKLGRPIRECADLDDIVQESLLEAFQTLRRGEQRSESRFRYWLARVVENNIRDHVRRGKALKRGAGRIVSFSRRAGGGAPSCGEESILSESLFPGAEPTPSQVMIGKELEQRIERSLLDLDERHREVIILRKLCGMSYAEIAETMGFAKEVTARSIFSRAWSKLERLMGLAPGRPGG